MYKIIPFIWYDLNEKETFFQTKESSVIITNNFLISMLKKLESLEVVELEETMLLEYFNNESLENVIRFLKENRLIKEKENMELNFNNIILYTNDSEFSELFRYTFAEEYSIIIVNSLTELKKFKFNDELLFCFLNPFKFQEYEEIVEIGNNENTILKIIFSYNHHAYISNYYKKDWMNPCPRCFFSELESQIRGEITNNTTNFQTIIDILYSKSENFSVEYPLTKKDYISIIYVLMRNMNSNLEHCDIDEVLSINLKDNSISKDIAYHWGYYDCYE